MRTLDIEFERDRSIGLGTMFGDGHTDIFSKILFLGCGSDVESKFNKKSKSNFLTIAILPSLLMSLESKNHEIVTINMAISTLTKLRPSIP